MNMDRWYSTALALFMLAGIAHADWTRWRGPEQLGTSPETGLPAAWAKDGLNLLWSAPVGCRSAPLILGDRVFMISRAGEGESRQERVVALDLDNGKLIWEHRFNVFLTDVVFHRLGWTILAADPETGYVYAHGVQGLLYCFTRDGEMVWKRSLTEEIGRISGYGGRTNSPILDGDQLIISSLTSSWGAHGKGMHRFFGMDKRTGDILWIAEAGDAPADTTYSVPVTATLDGAPILFTGVADGSIAALRPRTGETVWNFPLSARGIMSSVLYRDGFVYAVHGAANYDSNIMGRLVCLDARTGKEVWRVDGLDGQYSTPALHDGLLYVANNASNLHCVDARTGEVLWVQNYGNEAKGSPVVADGKIFVGDVPTGWSILEADRDGCKVLHNERFLDEAGAADEVYSTPAVAHGRVVLSTMNRTYCISTKPAAYRSAAAAPVSAESMMKPGETVRLQVEPAETVAAPGQSVPFAARGFDAKGLDTGPVKATWALKGLAGTIAEDGTFAADGTRIQAGHVEGAAGDLTAQARVRVVPPLPYEEDFNDAKAGLPPAGWITSKLKTQVAEVDGEMVLRKLADRPSPPFARLRCYIMPPIDAGYTVQGDLLGVSKKKRFLPDMGLINSRYLLILTGTSERTRQLRLVSWTPVPRILREVEFPWDGDTWYTAKMSVDLTPDGQGVVRAKVWPRGESEPGAWTLTMNDPTPNLAGSPGLYAYSVGVTEKSKGTEVLFDNVSITSN